MELSIRLLLFLNKKATERIDSAHENSYNKHTISANAEKKEEL